MGDNNANRPLLGPQYPLAEAAVHAPRGDDLGMVPRCPAVSRDSTARPVAVPHTMASLIQALVS